MVLPFSLQMIQEQPIEKRMEKVQKGTLQTLQRPVIQRMNYNLLQRQI